MKVRPACVPCCLSRVLRTAEAVTRDEWLHRKLLLEIMGEFSRCECDSTPAELIRDLFRRAAKTLGTHDPFEGDRKRVGEEVRAVEDRIRQMVRSEEDPITAAVVLAARANRNDPDMGTDFDLRGLLAEGTSQAPPMDTIQDLKKDLAGAKTILYVHDGAGEIIFDKILIETIRDAAGPEAAPRILSVVRRVPILADATAEDAEQVGLDAVAQIVDPGVDCLGLPLTQCAREFMEEYQKADLVIAKGQANFETLEGENRGIYFLLRVRCDVVADHLGARPGDLVIERV